MPSDPLVWFLAALAAFCIGVSKAGFSGISLISVFLLADIFGAKESLGVALPMLIIADLIVYPAFRKYSSWKRVWVLTWPALIGMAAGIFVLGTVDNGTMRKVIGGIILLMALIQVIGKLSPRLLDRVAETSQFGIFAGTAGGVATVLANAAGPIMQLYMLSRKMDKMELIGVGARFFLVINLMKLPLNAGLDLMNKDTLLLNLILAPAIALGVFGGKKVLHLIPQRAFEATVVVFAFLAGVRLVFF
ncbi:MAG: sulfite exporter TauE/SafE family protein [Akkermansiaceae bacterium]